MSLTQDEYVQLDTTSAEYLEAKQKYYPFQPDPNKPDNDNNPIGKEAIKTIEINDNDPFLDQDLNIVIHYYEKDCQNWAEEDYAKAYLYRDVYSTKNFSERVREQMSYYPGMHQSGGQPEEDPFRKNGEKLSDARINYWDNAMDNPNAFMAGLESKQGDFDYGKIFGSDASNKERAKNIGKLLTECIPCFGRLQGPDTLLPDGDLLELHALNIKLRTDILEKLMALFKDPGYMLDICQLLDLFSHMCPQDLLAMLAVLTQYLAKLNLEINFNLDFVIQLIGPILSPFLDAIGAWLDKWIQLILEPIICVVDHINETIALMQNFRVPFSGIKTDVGLDAGAALPFHQNVSNRLNIGGEAGFRDPAASMFEKSSGPYAGSWGKAEQQRFETPSSQKYNPEVPEYPALETGLAINEIGEAADRNNNGTIAGRPAGYTDEEEPKVQKLWDDLRDAEKDKQNRRMDRLKRNGSKWSKDDVPMSEKEGFDYSFDNRYNPVEKQSGPKPPSAYVSLGPVIPAIVQMRNIVQGAIAYIQDWFEYITQMIHDLLGVDFGWMTKKTGTTVLKSNIIQLIFIIKAIIEAIAKNGLKCGTDTNYDEGQLQYILEKGLNPKLPEGTKFTVKPNKDIEFTKRDIPDVKDNSKNPDKSKKSKEDPTFTQKKPSGKIEQETVTATIIKNCFKSVSREEMASVKDWISDFEKRGGVNG